MRRLGKSRDIRSEECWLSWFFGWVESKELSYNMKLVSKHFPPYPSPQVQGSFFFLSQKLKNGADVVLQFSVYFGGKYGRRGDTSFSSRARPWNILCLSVSLPIQLFLFLLLVFFFSSSRTPQNAQILGIQSPFLYPLVYSVSIFLLPSP